MAAYGHRLSEIFFQVAFRIETALETRIIPIQKNKLTRRRAADSTDSTARRDNEVRLFFWIGITWL